MSTPDNSTTVEVQLPPSRVEMVRMSLGLAVVCMIASVILGGIYIWTEPAKEHNIRMREAEMIRQLLVLSEQSEIQEVRRYLFWRGKELEVLYLTGDQLLHFDATGKELGTKSLPAELSEGASEDAKDAWVRQTVTTPDDEQFKYAGRFFIGFEGGRNAGYVIEGVTPGYKTWIRFFLAIDAEFGLKGLEVIEHEEDPGLGAEITQRYFKNQFSGRSFDEILQLQVIKDPLPDAWRQRLEQLGDIPLDEWLKENQAQLQKHPSIHAITGSTISSVAVANGVKRSLKNFRKRMNIVEKHL